MSVQRDDSVYVLLPLQWVPLPLLLMQGLNDEDDVVEGLREMVYEELSLKGEEVNHLPSLPFPSFYSPYVLALPNEVNPVEGEELPYEEENTS